MDFYDTYRTKLDLSPAKWIWYPSERTLSNTFVLFRKEFDLEDDAFSAEGYITADSRYLLYINGERIQWGPAPCDPRYMEADPLQLAEKLKKGKNVIAVCVLYYGIGEGTWVAGLPGLLFQLQIEMKNGAARQISSDCTWRTAIDWSHRPGGFQRSYLRSLQEICDGRKGNQNWKDIDYEENSGWTRAKETGDGDKPSVCMGYIDYANDGYGITSKDAALFKREIPILQESIRTDVFLAESGTIHWKKEKDYWFLFREPNIYTAEPGANYIVDGDTIVFEMNADPFRSYFFTFELSEQMVGFPFFEIEAPEGTSVELITLEGHELGKKLLLDSSFYCWSRYICHAGKNRFEAFDFESFKWLQLHFSNPSGGMVKIKKVGVRRRRQPFFPYSFKASVPAVQRLFEAGINTIYNAAQETIVDGMGRERQQYSGDVAHIQTAMRYALGDKQLCERFIQTYSTGITAEGLFMDSWPAIDRVKRLSYRQVGLTFWGNIVDHSIQFVFDCYKYYLSSGNLDCLRAPMKALDKMVSFLADTCGNGLYPTDNRNNGFIWLDHEAYSWTDHKTKECAINLYIAGMLEYAYLPLCRAFGYSNEHMEYYSAIAKRLVRLVTEKYWCETDHVFYDNLPYVKDRKDLIVADRTLAMAILYNYCKGHDTKKAAELLAGDSPVMKKSYPANAVWRMWALAKVGNLKPFLNDLVSIWAQWPSVLQNNTYQEYWTAIPDSTSEWSHVPAAPLVCIYEGVLGIKCNNIGGNRLFFTPQLKDFCDFETELYNNGVKVKVSAKKEDEHNFILTFNGDGCEITVEEAPFYRIEQISNSKYRIHYC